MQVEQYGGEYQKSAWDSILALLSDAKAAAASPHKAREKVWI